MTVRLVTDSTSDIPAEVCRELAISVVPLNVIFGEQVYRDGVDLDGAAFFAKLAASKQLPRTSQPSPAAFGEVYERLLAEGHEVLSVQVPPNLSGTYNSALLARDGCSAPDRITVLDSRWVSMAMGLAVVAGAKAAQQGADLATVRATVEHVLSKIDLLLFLDTLECLQRGGRIGGAKAFLGTLLSVKPLMTVRDGEVHPVGQVRTRGRAIERLRQWTLEHPQVEGFCVLHTASLADAQALFEELRQRYPNAGAYLTEVGAVVGTHVGPGGVGVALYG